MTPTPDQIVSAALELVGLPYEHHGRDEAIGLDCSGVLVATFRRLGIELQEGTLNYGRLPKEAYLVECVEMNFQRSSRETPQPGDIVHIKFKRDSQARHLGIIVPGRHGELQLVHSLLERRGVVLDLLRGALTNASIVGIYQWPR